jgi:hypothetical protein
MLRNLQEPSDFFRRSIRELVERYTLEVFESLNKHMNEMGLCITVGMLPRDNAQHSVKWIGGTQGVFFNPSIGVETPDPFDKDDHANR